MNEILEFLKQYNLTLEDCEETWVELVKNFEAVEQTLEEEERASKIKSLIEKFDEYHIVEEVKPAKKVKKPKKKVVEPIDININASHDRAMKKRDIRKKRTSLLDVKEIIS